MQLSSEQPEFDADDLMRLTVEILEDEDWTLPDDRGQPHEPLKLRNSFAKRRQDIVAGACPQRNWQNPS